jgi:hypothetical protein
MHFLMRSIIIRRGAGTHHVSLREGRGGGSDGTLMYIPHEDTSMWPILSRNKTINTIHNKLQAFLKLLEFRIIGSAVDVTHLNMSKILLQRMQSEAQMSTQMMRSEAACCDGPGARQVCSRGGSDERLMCTAYIYIDRYIYYVYIYMYYVYCMGRRRCDPWEEFRV